MCGFVGFANLNKKVSKDRSIIEKMNAKLQKRGPDEEGYFFNDNLVFGHRRLIIIDADNGKQPMTVKINDTTYTMVYNGQIYNKEELREKLKKEGYEFKGYSDTEVLLKSFIHYGTKILKELNGIFSFAIWNDKTKELFLVRDQFGIKPLYYTMFNGTLIFASEIKAILTYPQMEAELNEIGISELFGLRTSTYWRDGNF